MLEKGTIRLPLGRRPRHHIRQLLSLPSLLHIELCDQLHSNSGPVTPHQLCSTAKKRQIGRAHV